MRNDIAKWNNMRQAEMMSYTISDRVGKLFERIMKYVGFDWRLSTATIAALSAKEVFVSQLGILFSQGEVDENSDSLRQVLVKTYTPLQAFCVMLFCLLTIPCIATLAMIRREMNSWIMAVVEAVGFFVLAYVTTFIIFQVGTLLNIGTTLL
jgi:ferrous iron transport protein B